MTARSAGDGWSDRIEQPSGAIGLGRGARLCGSSSFGQEMKTGGRKMHPLVARPVDREGLETMGAAPISASADSQTTEG